MSSLNDTKRVGFCKAFYLLKKTTNNKLNSYKKYDFCLILADWDKPDNQKCVYKEMVLLYKFLIPCKIQL